jgi:hypothetical protein
MRPARISERDLVGNLIVDPHPRTLKREGKNAVEAGRYPLVKPPAVAQGSAARRFAASPAAGV